MIALLNIFAYPNGDYNNYSIECVKLAGYKTARTTDAGWNDKNTHLYKLKVIGISDDADLFKLRFQLSGLSFVATIFIERII